MNKPVKIKNVIDQAHGIFPEIALKVVDISVFSFGSSCNIANAGLFQLVLLKTNLVPSKIEVLLSPPSRSQFTT